MLESFSSGHLAAPVNFGVWSPKMDVIAAVHNGSENNLELYRMDWTHVNSLRLKARVKTACFSTDGRFICVATIDSGITLFNVESGEIKFSANYGLCATTIAFGVVGGLNLLAIGFEDKNLYIYSDFHFAVASVQFEHDITNISFYGEFILIQTQDKIIQKYSLDKLIQQQKTINSISSTLSNYWIKRQIIVNAQQQFNELWQQIWTECKLITEKAPTIATQFLLGHPQQQLYDSLQSSRIQKLITANLTSLKGIVAENFIPCLLVVDKMNQELCNAIEVSSNNLGIIVGESNLTDQIKHCLEVLRLLTKIESCFAVLFDFFREDVNIFDILENNSVTVPEFTEFLINYCCAFPIQNILLNDPPESLPTLTIDLKESVSLTGNSSCLNAQYATSIMGNIISLYNFEDEKVSTNSFETQGSPLMAFPFSGDSDGNVGCVTSIDGKLAFIMHLSDNEGAYEIPIDSAKKIIISNRNIAYIESEDQYFAVVDLMAPEEDDDEAEEEIE